MSETNNHDKQKIMVIEYNDKMDIDAKNIRLEEIVLDSSSENGIIWLFLVLFYITCNNCIVLGSTKVVVFIYLLIITYLFIYYVDYKITNRHSTSVSNFS